MPNIIATQTHIQTWTAEILIVKDLYEYQIHSCMIIVMTNYQTFSTLHLSTIMKFKPYKKQNNQI